MYLLHRMSFKDFLCNFTKLEMCMMTPVRETMSTDDAWQQKHLWKVTVHDGSWQRQINAGGCRNYIGSIPHCAHTRIDLYRERKKTRHSIFDCNSCFS